MLSVHCPDILVTLSSIVDILRPISRLQCAQGIYIAKREQQSVARQMQQLSITAGSSGHAQCRHDTSPWPKNQAWCV